MRPSPLLLAIAASVALTLPASVAAQGRPVEFGIDAGGSFDVSGSNTVAIGLPVQDFRAGIFVSDAVSIEPRVAFAFIDQDGSNLTAIDAQLGPVLHFSPDRGRPQGYVRPFGGVSYITDAGAVVSLGGALGVKLPVAERLAVRVEGSYAHGFDSYYSADAVGLAVGLSFFTR
jgi:hypothetical protein